MGLLHIGEMRMKKLKSKETLLNVIFSLLLFSSITFVILFGEKIILYRDCNKLIRFLFSNELISYNSSISGAIL